MAREFIKKINKKYAKNRAIKRKYPTNKSFCEDFLKIGYLNPLNKRGFENENI